MDLRSLRVMHLLKRKLPAPDLEIPGDSGAFRVDSCQRVLWVGTEGSLPELPYQFRSAVEVFVGAAAYEFLLRVASGLESEIVGETDIFGQLKRAWERWRESERSAGVRADLSAGLAADLAPWIQRLFEDTKEIRSRYLQGLGGASYGSLLRKLIRESSGTSGPVLLLGAGKLAHAVAPYLIDDQNEIWLSNRSAGPLERLREELASARPEARIRVIAPESEGEAWASAAHVVLCIPPDPELDSRKIDYWRARGDMAGGLLVHLGYLGAQELGGWAALKGFHSLEHLFKLQQVLDGTRMSQVALAAKACGERAKLRALGSSLTTPHGWEDLAVFA